MRSGALQQGRALTILWQALSARFDSAALRAFDWPPKPAPAWPGLRAWCLGGSLDAPLALAWHEPGALSFARAAALALELDGSVLLHQGGSSLERLLLRARVKWQDLHPGALHLATAIWDCGYVGREPQALAALARFEPRRPTFIVLQDFDADALTNAVQCLRVYSQRFRWPVRVLILGHTASPDLVHIPA